MTICIIYNKIQNKKKCIFKEIFYAQKNSEEKYRSLVEDANEAITMLDHDSRFIILNNVAARYLGGRPNDFIGKVISVSSVPIFFSSAHSRIVIAGMNNRNNQSKVVLNRWRVQGQDEEGMLPRAYMNHPANNLGSDRYVEPGDYLRLINMTFRYSSRKDLCDKLRVRSLNLALSARRILTLTNYSGQDPEVGQDASNPFWIGVDQANTPPPKMVTVSIAVGF